ncbi:MAG: T9SS type A sorting domain-containing protein, partial [Fibrobacter sp.]|nr:T9SS type A sorting domain-containing protein [Fibrobacter sp.]
EHADRNKTLSITFANYAAGYTGTIIYDDIKAGATTLFDFNKDKYDAFKRGYENTEEMIPEIKIVFDENYVYGKSTSLAKNKVAVPKFSINGNKIMFSTNAQGQVSVDVFSMNGRIVATLYNGKLGAGNYMFSLADMPKGQYIVRMKGAGNIMTQPVIIK